MGPLQLFIFGLFLAWFVGSGKARALLDALGSPGNTGSTGSEILPNGQFPTTSPNSPGTVATPVPVPGGVVTWPNGDPVILPNGQTLTLPGGGTLNIPGGPGGGGLAGT